MSSPLHSPTSPLYNMSTTNSKLKAAILIVSETASQDPSTDKCIPILKAVFGDLGDDQWDVSETEIVPDSALAIQKTIRNWTDGSDPVNLIVTSGGTGFATKDVTPEVRIPPRIMANYGKLMRRRRSHH
jgi:gephyrin